MLDGDGVSGSWWCRHVPEERTSWHVLKGAKINGVEAEIEFPSVTSICRKCGERLSISGVRAPEVPGDVA